MKFPWESKRNKADNSAIKQKEEKKEKPKQTIEIDDKRYNYESLTDEIKLLIKELTKADNLINLKKNKLKLIKEGKENIGYRIKENLKKIEQKSEES